MSITLGVYDVFGYAAPGSLYLALLAYVGSRLGWFDPMQLLRANTALTVIGAALASYLLGHMTYVLGLAFLPPACRHGKRPCPTRGRSLSDGYRQQPAARS